MHKQNAGDVLEELRDVQEDAELPRSEEDTVSVRMGWSTLYWVQLSNQFPSTHANLCDEKMLRERSHAQEFLSGPKLKEVLGVSTKQEQLRMPGVGEGRESTFLTLEEPGNPVAFPGLPQGLCSYPASTRLHVTAIELISLYGRGVAALAEQCIAS